MRCLRLLLLTLVSLCWLTACSKEPQTTEIKTADSAITAPARIFIEGQHYRTLSHPVLEPALNRYLTEYFWLGCPHCQNFEPVLKGYFQDRPEVSLVRKHPALGERWAFDARVYYALAESGHAALATELLAFYQSTRIAQNSLPDAQAITGFFEKHQLNPEHLNQLASSDTVLQAMEQANREMLDNRINGVPSIVVNGRFLVNDTQPEDMKTTEDYYQLLDYLLAKP